MVEGFAEFVFLELLFVVGRGHCEADFGYAVLEEFELVGGYPELGDGADVCVGKDDVVHYYLVIAVFVGVADDGAFEFDEFVGEGADFRCGWSNGSITASGAEMDMPGLMHIDNGTIGVFQNYENISLYLGVEANKYGLYQGLHTQYSLTGNLSYYLSPHSFFTAS